MTERRETNHPPDILLIDGDPEVRKLLRSVFSEEDYRFQEAGTAADGMSQAIHRGRDLIILELVLPDSDGIDVIREIRLRSHSLPIIVLSVRSSEREKIAALDAGADDFVTKPFAVGELLARIRAALRRSTEATSPVPASIFRTGNIEVDLAKRRILVAGNEVHLTRIEYKLLDVLIRQPDQVITHGQLLSEVWGPNHEDQTHYLRVYMLQLRRKLEADPAEPRYLRTVPGVGYRLTTEKSRSDR